MRWFKSAFIVTIVLLLIPNMIAFAVDSARVFSDDVVVGLNEDFVVPVKLQNNKGIMGFKINVSYPDRQIKLKNISGGSITQTGLFNTSITDYYSVKGSFDVVWSDSQNFSSDGTLFMLTFETLGHADYGEYEIKFSYSPDDTFNEKWQSVELDCENIKIKIADDKTVQKEKEKSTSVSVNAGKGEKVTDDYLIASVQSVLDSYMLMDITDVTDDSQKESILKFVNSRNLSFSPDSVQYASFEELKQAYFTALKNEAVSGVIESVDGDKIIEISGNIFDKYGADSFSELMGEDKQQAVNEALSSIASQGADTQNFAYVTDEDVMADTFDELFGEAKNQQENGIKVEEKPASKSWIIITVATVLTLLIVLVVTIIVIKKRNKK